MQLRSALLFTGLALLSGAAVPSARAARPDLDITASLRPTEAASRRLEAIRNGAAFRTIGVAAHVDERYGVPSFVWAVRTPGPPSGLARALGASGAEQAARAQLTRFANVYGLEAEDVQAASLRSLHDTGSGGMIAIFVRSFDGVPVFRDEMKVLMDRSGSPVAISGYLPGAAIAGKPASRVFRRTTLDGLATALDDWIGGSFGRGLLRRTGEAPGGYEAFSLAAGGRALPAGLEDGQSLRARRVLFHRPERLEPATYVEIMTATEAEAYVVSAVDGAILFRRNLMASDVFSYRVWADNSLHAPFDGPQGTAPTPHPTGNNDLYSPPFVSPLLLSLQNGPISTNDPWLPAGATTTNGNNVDAYVDLVSPDGFTAPTDFRASTTSANTFDRMYDVTQQPGSSSTQRQAAITQLFYDINFFHDWYYDVGFNEAAGNAQTSNYGRGGLELDNIRGEAQDYGGTNNANMATPADGGRPRMQMYVWQRSGYLVTVNSPAGIAGNKQAVGAYFGLSSFSLTGSVVLANDGVGDPADACQPVSNVSGKIALIHRSSCDYGLQVCNAQSAGAVGAIIMDNVTEEPSQIGGSPGCSVTIPVLFITLADGNAIQNALQSGPVNVTMTRSTTIDRDGDIDNQVVAHEWGHYISNRLIGDASGLSNNQGGGLGEGWGDFHALLMTVRAEDASVPSNASFSGVYAVVDYAISASLGLDNSYYFGIRRYPYSTDLTKNPLTFRHIQEGLALPAGPPVAFGANGAGNSEVHSTGEVWCNMLWECYAALLRDTGRLTFTQARDRMRAYLVAAYKMTPLAPTLLEAREALLSVAYANDPTDFGEFCAAFAKRGAGVGAVGPDRYSNDNLGVTESYLCGGDLQVASVTLDDSVHSCDGKDGYLDDGEVGYLTVTLVNDGTTTLSSTTATLSSSNPSVVFQSGTALSFPPCAPFGTTTARAFIRCSGAAGLQVDDFQIQYNDPGFAVAGPRNLNVAMRGNADEAASSSENVEAKAPPWTFTGAVIPGPVAPWARQEVSSTNHRFWGPDPGSQSDQSLVSPPLQVGSGTFGFSFQHAYSFEFSGGTYWDGGVVEITQNAGGSWTDIGSWITPGYNGTLSNISGNPLGGRAAFGAASPGYPALATATVNLGTTYANKTVQLRFRVGADQNTGDAGWYVDNLVFSGLTNAPFRDVVTDATPCSPVAVEEAPPSELSFAVAGSHPVLERPAFRFALPRAMQVRITVHDVSGRRVATLADGAFEAGTHLAWWSSGEAGGRPKPGVYFARMTADGAVMQQRLVVLSR